VILSLNTSNSRHRNNDWDKKSVHILQWASKLYEDDSRKYSIDITIEAEKTLLLK